MRIYSFAAVALLTELFITGCSKQLNKEPTSNLIFNNYYRTETELNTALAGVYNSLTFYRGSNVGTYARNLVVELAISTDESLGLENNGQSINPYKYNYDASEPNITNCYRTLYEGINYANNLLENVDKTTSVSTSAKNAIIGQALFLRAYCHFILTLQFGDVPLRLRSTKSPTEVNFPRAPAREVFQQIVRDMVAADTLVRTLSDEKVTTRVTKTAVEGILARVCLHAAGRLQDPTYFVEARKWAKTAIDRGGLSLNPLYGQVFVDLIQEKAGYIGGESIWELTFRRDNGALSQVGEQFGSVLSTKNNDIPTGYSYGQVLGTDLLYSSYSSGDQRRDWNLASKLFAADDASKTAPMVSIDPALTFRYANKFPRSLEPVSPRDKNNGVIHFPLLRYADLLLMFAEADNEVNGPTSESLEYVNQVRRRAFGRLPGNGNPAPGYADWTVSDQLAFRDSIRNERFRELAFEALRKQDLNRWGILASQMSAMRQRILALNSKYNTKGNSYSKQGWPGKDYALNVYENFTAPKNLLQPIPLIELNLNQAATQNPGW